MAIRGRAGSRLVAVKLLLVVSCTAVLGCGSAASAADAQPWMYDGRPTDSAIIPDAPPADSRQPAQVGGELLWARRAGGSGAEIGVMRLGELSDGTFVLVGRSSAGAVFGPGEQNETTLSDTGVFVARYASTGDLLWATSLASGDAWALDVAVLSDDSIVVTGFYASVTVFARNQATQVTYVPDGEDGFAARVLSDSSMAWLRIARSSSPIWITSAAPIGTGDVVVVFGFGSSVTLGGPEIPDQMLAGQAGVTSIALVRYSASGAIDWTRRVAGTCGPCVRIRAQPNGLLGIAGRFSTGDVTFSYGEPDQHVLAGTRGGFLARYMASGTFDSARLGWQASDQSGIGYLDADGAIDGTFWLSGVLRLGDIVFGPGQPNETMMTVETFDVVLARYDAQGELAWVRRAGGADIDEALGVAASQTGGAVIAGRIFDVATFGTGEANEVTLVPSDRDGFVARYASDGTLAWIRQVSGAYSQTAVHVIELPDRTTVAVGYFSGSVELGLGEPNETVLQSAGGTDFWIARFAE